MIAAPGAAGIREDQDTLFVIHEGLGFREVRGSSPVLHHEPCRMPFALPHDAPRAPCDFGHEIGAEALDDLVECTRHGRKRSQFLNQRVTTPDGFAALHRLAVARDGARREVALAVSERLVELDRESMGEVV